MPQYQALDLRGIGLKRRFCSVFFESFVHKSPEESGIHLARIRMEGIEPKNPAQIISEGTGEILPEVRRTHFDNSPAHRGRQGPSPIVRASWTPGASRQFAEKLDHPLRQGVFAATQEETRRHGRAPLAVESAE